jgi:tRNA nucleotidyltransferase/poly(A) polymerase
MELEAILVSSNRSAGVSLLAQSGLAEAIFPSFAGEKMELAIKVLSQLRKKSGFPPALACLFSGCPMEFAMEKCKVLKLSRNQTKHIKFLLANRGKLLDDKMSLSQLKLIVGEPYFWDLYELQRAIEKAVRLSSPSKTERKSVATLVDLRKRIKALGDVELRPKPLLDGYALIRLGAVQGPGLGQLAEEMYIAQLEEKLQRKEQAEQWVQKWLQKHRTIEE